MNAFAVNFTDESLGKQFGGPDGAVMLWALESAYRHVADCMGEMEKVTVRAEPDLAALAQARFRFSQSIYAKRQLVQKACNHLLAHVGRDDIETVRTVLRASAEYYRASGEHVRRWPPPAVAQDWAGYRDASRAIRARMHELIRAEVRLLLPLLRSYEHV